MTESYDYPLLYILMRTDLESMNPGKAVAQGVHAGHQFVHEIRMLKANEWANDQVTSRMVGMFSQWESSTPNGFGTTICLDVNEDSMRRVVEASKAMGLFAGIAHDPSYPLRDGSVTHFIPLDTCGFVFGEKDELQIILRQFNLMP